MFTQNLVWCLVFFLYSRDPHEIQLSTKKKGKHPSFKPKVVSNPSAYEKTLGMCLPTIFGESCADSLIWSMLLVVCANFLCGGVATIGLSIEKRLFGTWHTRGCRSRLWVCRLATGSFVKFVPDCKLKMKFCFLPLESGSILDIISHTKIYQRCKLVLQV